MPAAASGMIGRVMVALTLGFPLLLLAFMLVMERVEQPLRRVAVEEQIETFLESARPEEVETFVSEGFAPALESYWRRRRLTRLLPLPSRSTTRT